MQSHGARKLPSTHIYIYPKDPDPSRLNRIEGSNPILRIGSLGGKPFLGHTWILTWRIIPFSKWLITMVSKSPNWGYSPSKWPFYGL